MTPDDFVTSLFEWANADASNPHVTRPYYLLAGRIGQPNLLAAYDRTTELHPNRFLPSPSEMEGYWRGSERSPQEGRTLPELPGLASGGCPDGNPCGGCGAIMAHCRTERDLDEASGRIVSRFEIVKARPMVDSTGECPQGLAEVPFRCTCPNASKWPGFGVWRGLGSKVSTRADLNGRLEPERGFERVGGAMPKLEADGLEEAP